MLVVKLGGGDRLDLGACLDDVALAARSGRPLLLVHGGGAEADRLAAELGTPARHVRSASGVASRLTDAAALDALTMALAGRVKPRLVAGLARRGVAAVGLTGLDAGLAPARRKPALRVREQGRVRLVRDDLSGRLEPVRPGLLRLLLADGLVPVLSPPCLGEEGPLNVDADRLAAAAAAALGAGELLFLSDVPGLLRDPADPATLVPRLELADLGSAGHARDRMRQKLLAAREALAGGVGRVVIAAGRGPRPVRAALEGRGTVIEAARPVARR